MYLPNNSAEYWKESQGEPPSQSQPESQSQQPKIATTQRSAKRNAKERVSPNSDSDAEEKPVVVAKSTNGKGRAGSVKPPSTQKSIATRSTRGKTSSQKQPLFILDSDDEEEDADKDDDFRLGSDDEGEAPHDDEDDDDDDEFGATLKSLRSTGRSSRTATQASSKGKSSTGAAATKKKAPAIVVDDDSDDGGFKAFGARSRTKRK